MTTSPVWASVIRGVGISVLSAIFIYFMAPANAAAFGAYSGIVVTIASLADGIIEKYTGNAAFGSMKKS